MWFETLMDDCKKALHISTAYKGIFTPVFLKLAVGLIIGIIILVMGITMAITGGFVAYENGFTSLPVIMGFLGSIGLFVLIIFVVYSILWSLIEVGSIGLINAALDGQKPKKEHFFEAIKSYFGKTVLVKLILDLVIGISFPIWMTVILIYLATIGVLTGGWGMILLTGLLSAVFVAWPIAVVNGKKSGFDAVKEGFRFAKVNMKYLILLIAGISLISNYLVTSIGLLGTILIGWLIGGICIIYSKLIIIMKYNEDQKLL